MVILKQDIIKKIKLYLISIHSLNIFLWRIGVYTVLKNLDVWESHIND